MHRSGAVTIDESLVEIVEFGLADPSALGEHELIQMRPIPAREGGINRLGEFAEGVRPRRTNIRSGTTFGQSDITYAIVSHARERFAAYALL